MMLLSFDVEDENFVFEKQSLPTLLVYDIVDGTP